MMAARVGEAMPIGTTAANGDVRRMAFTPLMSGS
jgi:hypothetical protein